MRRKEEEEGQEEVAAAVAGLRAVLAELDGMEATPEVLRIKTRTLAELSKAERRMNITAQRIEVVYLNNWRDEEKANAEAEAIAEAYHGR